MNTYAGALQHVQAPQTARMRRTAGKVARLSIAYALLIVGSVVMLVPFLWMVSTSLKPPGEVFQFPPKWIPDPPLWSNYVDAWNEMPFGRFTINSVIVSTAITLGHLVTCSMGAYAFARLNFPGRDRLFVIYLATMMVPSQVTLIPSFILIRWLGWYDTYWALIVPGLASAYGTFLLRQFFLTLPTDLEDAAKIDGASYWQIYTTIVLPLSGPALATLGVFSFMGAWNSFLWPLIVTSSVEMRTVPIGLSAFQGIYTMGMKWHLIMAATVFSVVPVMVVFLAAQRYFVRGIALSGIKG